MQINFGKENKFHVYHSEGGERFLANCTRLNMIFIAGNSILLLLEIISPFFGYWHGVSLSMTLFFSFMGSFMLHNYSTKMIQDIYLLPNGRDIEVQYFNAFWMPKTEKLRITNLGYLSSSRIYNVDVASYQQNRKVYINFTRNLYKHPEYQEILNRLFNGQEFTFANVGGFETKTISQTTDDKAVQGKAMRARKQRKYD